MASALASTASDDLSEPLTAVAITPPDDQSDPPAEHQQPEETPATLHYAFTSGDIELVSSDHARLRMNFSVLQQHSSVFRYMTDLPQPAQSILTLPFTNASALTLEVLLCALDPAKDMRPVPFVTVFDQFCGLIDAYDISLAGNDVAAAVELSGLDLRRKYRFACVHNPKRKRFWTMECLSNHDFFVSRNIDAKRLRADYYNVLEDFWEAFKDRRVGGKDCFNKKCRASYCGTFASFRGQWKDVKSNTADALYNALKDVPLSSGRAVVTSIINGHINCHRCSARLMKHGLHNWEKLIASGQWVSDDIEEE